MSLANQFVSASSTQPWLNPINISNIAHIHQPNPTAILRLISNGNTTLLLKNHFVLAQANQIQCQFFHDANQTWHCQYGEHRFKLQSGMILALDNQVWQFELHQGQSFEAVAVLHFQISCDEEHVRLSIKHNDKTTVLGERVHHYPLLLLARQYRQDQQSGFDHTSCGWLDVNRLTKMIGIEAPVLNVQLHRAKQQMSKVTSSKHFIERRAGQIRLNCANVEIMRGASIEY
ncbi:MAG: hypothetical protein ACI9FJ_000141 [Alteromonadaceae bacterium]|jgi:hypothetical protein